MGKLFAVLAMLTLGALGLASTLCSAAVLFAGDLADAGPLVFGVWLVFGFLPFLGVWKAYKSAFGAPAPPSFDKDSPVMANEITEAPHHGDRNLRRDGTPWE